MQVDFRLSDSQQQAAKSWMSKMFEQRNVDSESASEILSEMYHKVTRERLFSSF